MLELRSGKREGIPYSLSRWTDVPASKWGWFLECLRLGQMTAFDPLRTAPSWWSLAPEDTLGLVFWTKDPTNLLRDRHLLAPYNTTVHVTATGWEEVEKGAPGLHAAGHLLAETARAFETVYWRFSPVPLLPGWEVLNRFNQLLFYAVMAGLDRVYVSFLQENDLIPETRTAQERSLLLREMSEEASRFGITVLLCADDSTLSDVPKGVCVPSSDFEVPGPLENCGCPVMADPFTLNEVCVFNCAYCYAADKSLSRKKRNTTKGSLRVLR